MEQTPVHPSHERSAVRASAAACTALWWAAGTAVTVAPILASFFTVNRSHVFWPALVVLTVTGSAFGLVCYLGPSTRFVERLVQLPEPMLVAVGYPISLGAGLWLENIGVEDTRAATALYLGVLGTLSALGWLCRWGPWWPPRTALRFASWLWISLSILLLPLLGLGLVFVPLAIAYRRAAQHFDRAPHEALAKLARDAS